MAYLILSSTWFLWEVRTILTRYCFWCNASFNTRRFVFHSKGVLDQLANRCLARGTNAWTDVDHTVYTMKNAGSEGFLSLMPVYLEHILYPTLTVCKPVIEGAEWLHWCALGCWLYNGSSSCQWRRGRCGCSLLRDAGTWEHGRGTHTFPASASHVPRGLWIQGRGSALNASSKTDFAFPVRHRRASTQPSYQLFQWAS